jgi:hypothetical protein
MRRAILAEFMPSVKSPAAPPPPATAASLLPSAWSLLALAFPPGSGYRFRYWRCNRRSGARLAASRGLGNR